VFGLWTDAYCSAGNVEVPVAGLFAVIEDQLVRADEPIHDTVPSTQEVLSATSIRVAHLGARSSYVARVEAGTGYQFPEHEKPPQHGCHQHGQHEGAEVRFTQN